MIGEMLATMVVLVCLALCYFACKTQDFAAILKRSSGQRQCAELDPNFTLCLTALHFVVNSMPNAEKEEGGDKDDEKDPFDDVPLASETGASSLRDGDTPASRILVPRPGLPRQRGSSTASSCRTTSGECAICLNSYKVADRVAWSTNPDCPHVFHLQCMAKWTEKVLSAIAAANEHARDVSCPCCRQAFSRCKVDASEARREEIVEQYDAASTVENAV